MSQSTIAHHSCRTERSEGAAAKQPNGGSRDAVFGIGCNRFSGLTPELRSSCGTERSEGADAKQPNGGSHDASIVQSKQCIAASAAPALSEAA